MVMKKRMMTRLFATKILNGFKVQGGLVLSVLIFFLLAPGSFAHQQKTAVTRILFNTNSGNIEVMHRFLVHDAEHAAAQIFGERQTLLESAESRQLFSSYVINRFAIEVEYANGSVEALDLSYVGEELDGQFVWVYQEIENQIEIQAMTVVSTALRDIWPSQSNLVNIERSGEVLSLLFAGAVEVLTVKL